MRKYITKNEIQSDMSQIAIDAIKELTDKTVENFKRTGLMSPEICLIALNILDEYSDNAICIITSMSKLTRLMEDADILLNELQANEAPIPENLPKKTL